MPSHDHWRGSWGWEGRRPRACAQERDYAGDRDYAAMCSANTPPELHGWVCTRTRLHRGDHVAHAGRGIVLARWGRNGEMTDA